MGNKANEIFESLYKGMRIKRPQSMAEITTKEENFFKYKTGETINTIKKKDFEDFYNKLMEGSIKLDWYKKKQGVHNCDFYVIGGILVTNKIAIQGKSEYSKGTPAEVEQF